MKTLTKLTLAVTMLLASMTLCNAQVILPWLSAAERNLRATALAKLAGRHSVEQLERVSEHQSVYGATGNDSNDAAHPTVHWQIGNDSTRWRSPHDALLERKTNHD